MSSTSRRGFALALLLCAGVQAVAQGDERAGRDRLLAEARRGTQRYQDAGNAIADGFKRVGVEFPAMGEHWVSLSRVMENRFDAARPSVLTYITVDGKRRLAGVGYTALLAAGDTPPRTPARLDDWHEHNGSVIDESLPGRHGTQDMLPPEVTELGADRLAILHAWVWETNPAGLFATDNWRLPLVRAREQVKSLPHDALRGLALAEDSASYYEQTLVAALELTDADARRAVDAIRAARRDARAAAFARPSLHETALAASWARLWSSLETALPSRTRALREIRAKL
jgi:hypothetical protein